MEVKENQIAALFMGAMVREEGETKLGKKGDARRPNNIFPLIKDDYDAELRRIAEAKAELQRREAAGKRLRTEMVQMKPGESRLFHFTGDVDGV